MLNLNEILNSFVKLKGHLDVHPVSKSRPSAVRRRRRRFARKRGTFASILVPMTRLFCTNVGQVVF